MHNLHITIGVTSIVAIALSALTLLLDPGPIDDNAAALIATGLVVAGLSTLSGLTLARAPWGRWGLAATVVLGMGVSSVSSSQLVWVVYVTGAVALVGLFGPWLRLWTRHHRIPDGPGSVPVALISVAAVATLYIGLCAFERADWTHWVLAGTAVGSSVLFAQGAAVGLWGLRLAVGLAGALASAHSLGPGVVPLMIGILTVTVLAWLPAAKRTTTVITAPVPPPTKRTTR